MVVSWLRSLYLNAVCELWRQILCLKGIVNNSCDGAKKGPYFRAGYINFSFILLLTSDDMQRSFRANSTNDWNMVKNYRETAHLVSGLFHQTSFSKVSWVLDPGDMTFMSCSALVYCFQGVKYCYFVKPAGVCRRYAEGAFFVEPVPQRLQHTQSGALGYYFSKQSFI